MPKSHSGGAKPQGRRFAHYPNWRARGAETKTDAPVAAEVAQQIEQQIAAPTVEPAHAEAASPTMVPERKRRRSAPTPTRPLYNARELREQLAAIGSPSRKEIMKRTGLDARTLQTILAGEYDSAIAAPIRKLGDYVECDVALVFRPRVSPCRVASKSAVLSRTVLRRKNRANGWYAAIRWLDEAGEERALRRRVETEEAGRLLLNLWAEEIEMFGSIQTVPAPKPGGRPRKPSDTYYAPNR